MKYTGCNSNIFRRLSQRKSKQIIEVNLLRDDKQLKFKNCFMHQYFCSTQDIAHNVVNFFHGQLAVLFNSLAHDNVQGEGRSYERKTVRGG